MRRFAEFVILSRADGEGSHTQPSPSRSFGVCAPQDDKRFRFAFAALVLFLAVPAFAQQNAAAHYFANLSLVDQNGRHVDLYNDLMKGRTVIINTFYATCEGACPAIAHTIALMQQRIGDRLGRDVSIVSITVDPKTDTPAALKAYAQKMNARPGWTFLTGSPQQVNTALSKLGQAVDSPENHTNIILVGNDRTGLWKKVFGLAKADDVYAVVASVIDDRGTPSGGR